MWLIVMFFNYPPPLSSRRGCELPPNLPADENELQAVRDAFVFYCILAFDKPKRSLTQVSWVVVGMDRLTESGPRFFC